LIAVRSFRELRPEYQGPVVESLPNDLWIEPIGRRLQGVHIRGPETRVVVFPEPDALPLEFPRDEVVSIEVIGGLEGHERPDAEHERPEHLVAE